MNISNYRPISLLTVFWKVFEKVMCSRLMEQISIKYWVRNNLDSGKI